MNETVTDYLFQYAANPDPRYAVMLKGKWGCGKSFFIIEWIKSYNAKHVDKESVLEPIYVSLYGLKDTTQITKAIEKELYPVLYSKGADFAKKIFKIAGKIAFKTTLDWNDDKKDDISFEATLDTLSLLVSKGDNKLGTKLIIFDDLERCLIDMKLLLGYINNFVEHGACHVILIGDETHFTEEAKNTLVEFKEKTVGRELEVSPDNDAAINHFLINDIPLNGWLTERECFIKEIFTATQCDNLRILRQCLYDFSTLLDEIGSVITDKGTLLMENLLATYIVCYCEYRGDEHDLLEDWDIMYASGVMGNDPTKDRISKLQRKYRESSIKHNFEILNHNYIRQIIEEIKTGFSLKQYAGRLLNQVQQETTRQDKLVDFLHLSADEFETECNALMNDIKCGCIPNMYVMGKSLAILAFFDAVEVKKCTKQTISRAKKYIKAIYTAQGNKEDLYQQKLAFQEGISSFGNYQETEIGQSINEFTTDTYNEFEKKLRNKIEETLCNITDDNVDALRDLSQEITPDHQCAYRLTSVFKNLNANEIFESIVKLNNASIYSFCRFLSLHYNFVCFLGDGCNRYQDDLITLTDLLALVKSECGKRKSIDKYVYQHLIKYLEGAIKRAGGDNSPINV